MEDIMKLYPYSSHKRLASVVIPQLAYNLITSYIYIRYVALPSVGTFNSTYTSQLVELIKNHLLS